MKISLEIKKHIFLNVGQTKGERRKVKLSLYLVKHHVMKTYGGVEAKFHALLTSVLVPNG
jgi:hypothetical protein